jgi:phosphatidylglycerol---prolipoprotein diacylglyceryl transferase
MVIVDINPVAFSIGPLDIRWYGLMYVVGIIIGLLVAWPYAKSKGINEEKLETLVFISIIAGLVGARLYYVVQQPLEQFIADPVKIIAVWEGGMAFYGAIFAVVLTLIIGGLRMKMPVWSLLDMCGLFGIVGQFFGRIGNIINGDVIGYATDLPWGFIYANPASFAPRHDIAYQPAAVYEALMNVIIFIPMYLLRNRLKPGRLFFLYIFAYSTGQIILFILRDNVVIFLGLKQAQLTAIAVILLSAIVYWWFFIRQQKDTKAGNIDGNS